MTQTQASEAIRYAMRDQRLTFSEIAQRPDMAPLWTAAAVLDRHPFPRATAEGLVSRLDLTLPVGVTAVGASDGA